jgi:hypothetical protein
VQFGSTFRYFAVQIVNAQETRTLGLHYVAPQHGELGEETRLQVYAASQPMLLTANAGQFVYVVSAVSGVTGGAQCGLSGVRQTLG